MNKYIIYLSILISLAACSKKEKVFSDNPSIYFADDLNVDFTFAKIKSDEAVLMIPVEIAGYKANAARRFTLEIVKDSTTAVAGLHYKIINESVELPADSFRVNIPVTVYNNDPLLTTRKVRLYLRIVPNTHFTEVVYNKQALSLHISDVLLKPKIWDSKYSGFFGTYSQVKHRKILELCNITEIPDVYDGGSFNYKWDSFGRATNNYYKEHYPQYDENNQIIEPWM